MKKGSDASAKLTTRDIKNLEGQMSASRVLCRYEEVCEMQENLALRFNGCRTECN